jgi:hypothetical protein
MGPGREATPDRMSRGRRRGCWGRVGPLDRVGATICALLLAGVLCGCGGSGGPSTGTALATKAPAARVFASSVNLRAADLPGAEAGAPEGASPRPSVAAIAFARCDGGISPRRIVSEARSTLLSAARGSVLVRSRVTLWPSEALAARNLAAFASELGSHCELRYGGTSVSRLSVPLSGGVRALGLRVIVRSRSAHTGEIGYHDIVAFVCGSAEIALTAAGFSRPVEPQTERRLLEILYRRASTARKEL